MAVSLQLSAAPHVSLTHLKNGRPVLGQIAVTPDSVLTEARLRVEYRPDFISPETLELPRTYKGDTCRRTPGAPKFDEARVAAVTAAQPGSACVQVLGAGGEVLAESVAEFTWLPAQEWGGTADFPESLAAHCEPGSPAVADWLDSLKCKGFNAEEAPAEAVAKLLADMRHSLFGGVFRIAPAPEDWQGSCTVEPPAAILQGRGGSALGAALLMAGGLARLRLSPMVILLPGHVLLAVPTQGGYNAQGCVRSAATFRNMAALGGMVLAEVSAEGGDTPRQAQERAGQLLAAPGDDDDFLCLDLQRCWREGGIRPNVHGLPEPPVQYADTHDVLVTARPRTRMENWQLKLLDLSLRNNLLNSPMDGARQIRLLLPDMGALEDALADGKSFRITPAGEGISALTKEDGAKYAAIPLDSGMKESLHTLFNSRKLMALKPEGDLKRSLQTLYKNARTEMEESGANTLYLACGFLKWYRKDSPKKPILAPILLLPVTLVRPSVRDGYTLRGLDEETRVNLTLLQFLKTEHSIRLPELEGDLPADASGVDVAAVFSAMRRGVAGMEGWEVLDACSLGCYSFTKYLMWKDLVDRQEDLLRNPVVKQIASTDRGAFPEQVPFPPPATLDDTDPRQVLTPLSSDSSQLSAVIAAEKGKSFVLIGPPGTGKSQSITNLIAHCLGHGKSVLFVAEKAAALNVVFNRLKKIGLGDFCMQLHSGKANKKEALDQLKAAMAAANTPVDQQPWGDTVAAMQEVRNILNDLPRTLDKPLQDGTSLYDDIDMLAEYATIPDIRIPDQAADSMTPEQRRALLASAHELSLHFALVADAYPGAAADMKSTTQNSRWEEQLAAALSRLEEGDAAWEQAFAELAARVGGTVEGDAGAALRAAVVPALRSPARDNSALLPAKAWKVLQSLHDMLPHAEMYRRLRSSLSLPYPESAAQDAELAARLQAYKERRGSFCLLRWWSDFTTRRYLRRLAGADGTPDCAADMEALLQMRKEQAALAPAVPLPPYLQRTTELAEKDIEEADAAATRLEKIGDMEETAAALMRGDTPNACGPALAALQRQVQARDAILAELAALLGNAAVQQKDFPATGDAARWARELLALRSRWRDVVAWNAESAKARSAGNAPLADALESCTVSAEQAETALLVNLARTRLRLHADRNALLNGFSPRMHDSRIADYVERDKTLMACARAHIAELLTKRAATYAEDARELAVLQHEMSKQRGQMPLRQLLLTVPGIMRKLKPCMLMSPLSVAQYLSTSTEPFDIVVFDEASQIPVWDAIGVIGRGKNAVIVGDPRQMPPTSFFGRSKDDEDEVEEQDMESILDECRACGIPEMKLAWHYRSKSESLIAFSNMKYYEGELTTFPAPVTSDTALQYHHTGGTYIPGSRKRINPVEAKALVDHVLQTLRTPGFRYTEATSIGIVTFNMQQQSYIEDLLDEARAQDPALEPYFADSNPEAIFIKNLENVQGDERGVIYFSTTYGRDDTGKMSMNFGPLNLEGGQRRLNVAITRARCGMHVFTSMAPEDIDLSRTSARGAADLRDFLDYAKRGAAAFMAGKSGSGSRAGGLAGAVAGALQERGWHCTPNVGVSSFRISLGVQDPRNPQAMLAGIMLDGKGYAAANTARDRDVLRPSVLGGLGWHLLRGWSMDWWRNPQECISALDAALCKLRDSKPAPPQELPSLLDAAPAAPAAQAAELTRDQLLKVPYAEYTTQQQLYPETASDATLAGVIVPLVQKEAPISVEFLCKRICQLAGTKKLGKETQERIIAIAKERAAAGDFSAKREKGADGKQHTILIPAGEDAPKVLIRARGPRSWEDIPASEFKEAAKHLLKDLDADKWSDEHLEALAAFYDATTTKEKKDFMAYARNFA